MIKQWSIVVKLSFICFLLLFVAQPIRSAADSYLGDDGKIQFKVDRFEDKDQEKNKKEHKETELDKASIELFNTDVEEEIQKKKENKKKMESLRDSLFIKQKENNRVKNTKNSLFSSEYVVRKSADEVASNQTMNEKPISTTIIILLGGGVLLICIGIYTVLRKSWR
ncbi:type VII secretion protein EssA [Bacillus albus]|uniref:Type VII secretion protein EssA n=1 Tax=Bacillus albus TaxID=2026189 RepID=A0ABN5UB21_9BACI|nr:type VII secretion protein EssA [Bacillus albus]